MVGFMEFPREVRDMVYGFSLCVDGILAPYREKYKIDGDYDGPPPTVALLATNKQIRDEALPVLFGKNTWRVSSKATALSERCYRDPTGDPNSAPDPDYDHKTDPGHYCLFETIFARFNDHFRNVTLDYNFQEADDDRAMSVANVHRPSSTSSAQERIDKLHHAGIERLLKRWEAMWTYVGSMHYLKSIALSIQNLYCGFGCCRLDIVKHWLQTHISDPLGYHVICLVSSIKIEGARSNAEKLLVQEELRKRLQRNALPIMYKASVPAELWVDDTKEDGKEGDDDEDKYAYNEDEATTRRRTTVRTNIKRRMTTRRKC